jgi:hypothetical protein
MNGVRQRTVHPELFEGIRFRLGLLPSPCAHAREPNGEPLEVDDLTKCHWDECD